MAGSVSRHENEVGPAARLARFRIGGVGSAHHAPLGHHDPTLHGSSATDGCG